MKRKDMLGLKDVTREEITRILDTAQHFRAVSQRRIKKVPTLRGKSVVHLFLEPSTRTRTSFDIAATAFIFFTCRKICKLAGNCDFNGHHSKLARYTRKINQ